MKELLLSLLMLLGINFTTIEPVKPAPIIEHLQNISYTIHAAKGQGSGVIITRHGVNYVWTAGHVVASNRHVKPVLDNLMGQVKLVVYFDPVTIVREVKQGGKTVGMLMYVADVIKYSDAEVGQDLALLKVRQTEISVENTVFYLEDNIIPIGTELYHVGSFFGQPGANSFSAGVLSQYGRMFLGTYFDQSSCEIHPGSSGAGLFLHDGRYIGMLVRAGGEMMGFIVPIRRMKIWAHKVGVEWALDSSLTVVEPFVIEETDDSPSLQPSAPTENSTPKSPDAPAAPVQPSEPLVPQPI